MDLIFTGRSGRKWSDAGRRLPV